MHALWPLKVHRVVKYTVLTHWLPELFAKNAFFVHFGGFHLLDFGQISFNLVEKAFATQQFTLHAASVASIVFYEILRHFSSGMRRSFWTRNLNFSFDFPFSPFLFFLLQWLAFCWACLQLKKNFPESVIETCKFDHGVAMCTGRKFAPTFSLNFFSIFVHISDSIRPITLIWWSSLERSYPPAEVGPKWWRQKWKKGPGSSRPVMAGFNNKYQLTKIHPLT